MESGSLSLIPFLPLGTNHFTDRVSGGNFVHFIPPGDAHSFSSLRDSEPWVWGHTAVIPALPEAEAGQGQDQE